MYRAFKEQETQILEDQSFEIVFRSIFDNLVDEWGDVNVAFVRRSLNSHPHLRGSTILHFRDRDGYNLLEKAVIFDNAQLFQHISEKCDKYSLVGILPLVSYLGRYNMFRYLGDTGVDCNADGKLDIWDHKGKIRQPRCIKALIPKSLKSIPFSREAHVSYYLRKHLTDQETTPLFYAICGDHMNLVVRLLQMYRLERLALQPYIQTAISSMAFDTIAHFLDNNLISKDHIKYSRDGIISGGIRMLQMFSSSSLGESVLKYIDEKGNNSLHALYQMCTDGEEPEISLQITLQMSDVTKVLINNGVDVNARNNKAQTPSVTLVSGLHTFFPSPSMAGMKSYEQDTFMSMVSEQLVKTFLILAQDSNIDFEIPDDKGVNALDYTLLGLGEVWRRSIVQNISTSLIQTNEDVLGHYLETVKELANIMVASCGHNPKLKTKTLWSFIESLGVNSNLDPSLSSLDILNHRIIRTKLVGIFRLVYKKRGDEVTDVNFDHCLVHFLNVLARQYASGAKVTEDIAIGVKEIIQILIERHGINAMPCSGCYDTRGVFDCFHVIINALARQSHIDHHNTMRSLYEFINPLLHWGCRPLLYGDIAETTQSLLTEDTKEIEHTILRRYEFDHPKRYFLFHWMQFGFRNPSYVNDWFYRILQMLSNVTNRTALNMTINEILQYAISMNRNDDDAESYSLQMALRSHVTTLLQTPRSLRQICRVSLYSQMECRLPEKLRTLKLKQEIVIFMSSLSINRKVQSYFGF